MRYYLNNIVNGSDGEQLAILFSINPKGFQKQASRMGYRINNEQEAREFEIMGKKGLIEGYNHYTFIHSIPLTKERIIKSNIEVL